MLSRDCDADAVFPLDADEFLRIPSRPMLERALAELPPGHYGQIAWPTFVPPLDGARATSSRCCALRAARQRSGFRAGARPIPSPGRPCSRVTSPRSLPPCSHGQPLRDPRPGQHASPGVPHVLLPASVVELCHVPVRSIAQFVVKIATSTWRASQRTATIQPALANAPRRDQARRAADARQRCSGRTSSRPGLVVAVADARAIDTDDESPFLADIALRYTPGGADDPLPVVAAAVERLVRRIRRDAVGRNDRREPAPQSRVNVLERQLAQQRVDARA